jgi:hypothetical protein
LRPLRAAGVSLVAFGVAILIGWVAAALVFGQVIVDVAALAMIGLGVAVLHGSRRAVPWARALAGAYAIASVVAALGAGAEAAGWLPWRLPPALTMALGTTYACLAAVLCWSLVNLWLLREG